MRTNLLKTMAVLLLLGTGWATAAAAPRLAVVAVTPAAEGRTVADQLTAALSRDPATLALVERQQIDAVLRELGLAAAQGRGGQLALGERLNAQGLLLLEVADQTLTARLVDSASGLILFVENWPLDPLHGKGLSDAVAAVLRERILAGLRQAAAVAGGAGGKGVAVVAVAPLLNRIRDDTDNRRAETLSRLLALQLGHQPGLLLVERDELRRVVEEKALATAAGNRLVAAAVVVTGNTLFSPAKPGDNKLVVVETVFQRGTATQPGPAVTGDTEDLMGLAAKLAREIAARLRPGGGAVAADSASAAPFDAAGEARYFLWLAKIQGNNESRRPFLETAYALNPQAPEIRQALAEVLFEGPYENWPRFQKPPPKRAVDEGLPSGIRALRLLLEEPGATADTGGFPFLLFWLRPENLAPEQRGQIRLGRALLRRYLEREWDVRDGVPHAKIPWANFLVELVPALFETPEEAIAYVEPIAAHWLRSPERLPGEDTLSVFSRISYLRESYVSYPHWNTEKANALFTAMMRRLQPLAAVGDPLTRAEAAFMFACQDKKFLGADTTQSMEAMIAAGDLLGLYQARAATNPDWTKDIKDFRQGRLIWVALKCLPWPDQEKWFNSLLLPALRQEYRRAFFYPVGEYFLFPARPVSVPEYQRIISQAYAVLSRQSGQDLDHVLSGLRLGAERLGVPLALDLPATDDWPARNIDLSAAGLPKDSRGFIAGFVQEPEIIWLQVKGGWNGVLRYDISQARVTGAVKWPWGSGRNPSLACGGQQLTVTADAVWWSEGSQLCRLPKTAFVLPATPVDPATATVPGLNPPPSEHFVVMEDWIYWCAENGGIWRLRHAAGKPVGAAECVADHTRLGGVGPLDGGESWWPKALAADPSRHRVLWMVQESNSAGPRNGIWSHHAATGRVEQVITAPFWDSQVKVSTVAGDRWVYSGNGYVSMVFDLLHNQVAYNLRPGHPFSWQRPGNPQPVQAPELSLAANSSECFDGWTISCFTVTSAAPDAILMFAPRGDKVRVRVFTPTACLAEVKNDARLLDQMVGGAWWTPRGILVAAVPERAGPMKLWLYEAATNATSLSRKK